MTSALHTPRPDRYAGTSYRRCGRSGLRLPPLSLGLWQNFGGVDVFENSRAMILHAFDRGITHFDLANNYGPPYGSAESTFGRVLAQDLRPYRDELVISTKAGYDMWPGPYGEWGSRKYLIASLDQSLRRMGLDYVDIFYSHRPDPDTPVEETMMALDQAVRSGKALYAAISNYDVAQTEAALAALPQHCLLHQMNYSMLRREPEAGLLELLRTRGVGAIAFSPLAQGLLTERYLGGIPQGSRASRGVRSLKPADIDGGTLQRVQRLATVAAARGQSLAQLALAWVLRHEGMTSAIIGASSVRQIDDSLGALSHLDFDPGELAQIDAILAA